MQKSVLAKIDRAITYLREAVTLQEVKEVIAMADAAKIYAKEVGASIETTNYASEVRLRAERRLGEILLAMPKRGPEHSKGGGSKGSKRVPLPDAPPTLASAGISKKTSARAKTLAAVPEKNFEEALTVESGKELNHNRVANEIKSAMSHEKRTAARQEAAGAKPLDPRIVVGDFREHAAEIADGSLSLVFTDPPYDRKASKMLPALADFAAAKLADGGSLVMYIGHLQLPAAFAAFEGKLRHWWTCACVHSGELSLMREYGIRVGWKPMLWFVKGTRDDKSNIVFDTVTGGKEKTAHDWQQAEAEAAYWIENLCPADGIVCDPFLGGGTTAAAAKALGRKWIGFEIDPDTAKIASERLSK